jgi:acyl-CoA thioesterase II
VTEEERWSSAEDMQAVLDLEPLDRDLFRARNAISARARQSLYGGQVAAQALRAAGLTVDPDRHAHSLHGYFLRPGRADHPVILHVDRDRDGRSFSARHVRAVQDGEVIFSMLASFHVGKSSAATYDAVPTSTPPPPDATAAFGRGDSIVEMREITPMRIEGDRISFPDSLWIRVKEPLPDDRLLRACALTYVSDMGSGFGQLRVEGLPSGGTSIDHAVWFHEDIAVDDWMLLELRPSKAGESRGVYTGGVRDRHGVLGLLCVQEGLLRPHSPQQLEGMRKMIESRRSEASTP